MVLINENDSECLSYKQYNLYEKKYENKILFNGYFQNEKYFKMFRNEMFKLFDINESNESNIVFIHVRRTDYLISGKHNVNLSQYYKHSINYINKSFNNRVNDSLLYYIFSDDITYCKNSELFKDIKCVFIENLNEYDSLKLMSCCKLGGICANSTFSWWVGWLNQNKNKVIIFPDKWFNNDWNVDIYFEKSYIRPT